MRFLPKLDLRMGYAFANTPQEFPAQGGEKPSFHFSHLADLLLVLSQDKESLLCKVSGITFIFCQGETKAVQVGVIFRNDRF
jgi:hypothetical protein